MHNRINQRELYEKNDNKLKLKMDTKFMLQIKKKFTWKIVEMSTFVGERKRLTFLLIHKYSQAQDSPLRRMPLRLDNFLLFQTSSKKNKLPKLLFHRVSELLFEWRNWDLNNRCVVAS